MSVGGGVVFGYTTNGLDVESDNAGVRSFLRGSEMQ